MHFNEFIVIFYNGFRLINIITQIALDKVAEILYPDEKENKR